MFEMPTVIVVIGCGGRFVRMRGAMRQCGSSGAKARYQRERGCHTTNEGRTHNPEYRRLAGLSKRQPKESCVST